MMEPFKKASPAKAGGEFARAVAKSMSVKTEARDISVLLSAGQRRKDPFLAELRGLQKQAEFCSPRQ